jgi:Flp pilus assembly protein TadD
MKHITILLAFIMAGFTNIFSQEISGLDYNDLTSKLAKSNKALDNPKKSSEAKFWIERGKLFQDIADVNTQYLRMGLSDKELTLFYKEPKEKKQENGMDEYIYDRFIVYLKDGKVDSWKETQTIVPKPLEESLNCYKKAIELDAQGKSEKKIGEGLKSLKSLYLKSALNCYNLKDTLCSYLTFKTMVEIDGMKQVNQVDTAIIYNAGLTAITAGYYDDAIKLLRRVVDLKYPDPLLYANLQKAYLGKKDTADAVNALKEGIATYPNDINIIIELINYYITVNDTKTALEYIARAKQNDPKNRSFYYVEGYLYGKMASNIDDKLNDLDIAKKTELNNLNEEKKAEFKKTGNNIQKYKPIDDKYKKLSAEVELKYKTQDDSLMQSSVGLQAKAAEQYKQAIEIDPSYFEAYYNLGFMYYYNGVRLAEQADKENDDAKYQAKKDASADAFKKAVPYMELAYETNQKVSPTPENTAMIKKNRDMTLDVLKTLYYRLKMDDQFNRIKKLQEEAQ